MIKEFMKGIWKENPVLVLLLGMCPLLAVTTNATNGAGMGIATTCVLIGSNTVISLIRNIIPKKIRIPCYIIVIATFVTIIQFLMDAFAPASLNDALGIFIPLIVVNCIVLGRAEAFASKNGPIRSIFDGLGMGIGFTIALVLLGGLREFFGGGTLFAYKIIIPWEGEDAFMLMGQAPGAFIVLGFILAGMNYLDMRKAQKTGKKFKAPKGLDCKHCNICDMSKIDD